MEEDDEVKSLLSGAFTGALFKSTAGARKCAMGTGMTIITFFILSAEKEITFRGYSTKGWSWNMNVIVIIIVKNSL